MMIQIPNTYDCKSSGAKMYCIFFTHLVFTNYSIPLHPSNTAPCRGGCTNHFRMGRAPKYK
jgi:hypothetical protein